MRLVMLHYGVFIRRWDKTVFISGSNSRTVLSPKGQLAMPGENFGSHNWELLLESDG